MIFIEKCEIFFCILIPQTIPILYQIKKRLDFSKVEAKSLDFSTVGVTDLSLTTLEPESLDFSMQNMKVLNLASIPQKISIL